RAHLERHSFPTRRSSDLDDGRDRVLVVQTDLQRTRQRVEGVADLLTVAVEHRVQHPARQRTEAFLALFWFERRGELIDGLDHRVDRKSTRLNSSHVKISY